jgi:hypothetical protein
LFCSANFSKKKLLFTLPDLLDSLAAVKAPQAEPAPVRAHPIPVPQAEKIDEAKKSSDEPKRSNSDERKRSKTTIFSRKKNKQ